MAALQVQIQHSRQRCESVSLCVLCVCIGVRPHVCVLSVHAHVPLCEVGGVDFDMDTEKMSFMDIKRTPQSILYVIFSFLSIRMIQV